MNGLISKLEEELNKIKDRNTRVEADKAWETSFFRVITITIITYIIAGLVLHSIGIEKYLLSALIPALGFYLSTQTIPPIKRWWIKKYRNF